MKVGIDFDNTIAGYDHLFSELAARNGWVDGATTKSEVREAVRALDDGETKWQFLQADVYGPEMIRATMLPGVDTFISACKVREIPVFVVSHKSRYAKRDRSGTNLRDAAMQWMTSKKFFEPTGLGIPTGNVFFESTRSEKIARIAELGCTHFIDDLAEVLEDPDFPPRVQRYLLAGPGSGSPAKEVSRFSSWRDISRAIFGNE